MARCAVISWMVLAWLTTSALGARHACADEKPCSPTVRLEGKPESVEPVAAELIAHGVAVDGSPACMSVLARVRSVDTGIELKLADTQGRSSTRVLRDPATVAAVIESWASADLVAPMLDNAEPGAVHGAAPVVPSLPVPAAVTSAPAAAVPVQAEHRYALSLWLGGALGNGNTRWGDIALQACGRLGPVCLGGLLRGSLDFAEHGTSKRLDTDRASFDALFTAELPIFTSGRWLFNPGFGLGVGVVQNTVDGNDRPPPGGTVRRTDGSMRVAATSKLGVRVREHLYLGTLLGFEFVPLGRTSNDVNDHGVQVAGMPRWYARAALGVTYERF